MTDRLYLQRKLDRVIHIFAPWGDGGWRMIRIPPKQERKVIFMLRRGKHGWGVEDVSPGAKLATPMLLPDAPKEMQSEATPPLGPWTATGTNKLEFELMDILPCPPKALILPVLLETSFVTLDYSEEDNVGLLILTAHKSAIKDSDVDAVMKCMKELMLNVAARPEMVVLLQLVLQDAAVPTMRHIRRLIAYVTHDIGECLFLCCRGNAMVIKPQSLVAKSVIRVVRMVEKMLPAPWPDCIVSDAAAARAFLHDIRSNNMQLVPVNSTLAEEKLQVVGEGSGISKGIHSVRHLADVSRVISENTSECEIPPWPVGSPLQEQGSSDDVATINRSVATMSSGDLCDSSIWDDQFGFRAESHLCLPRCFFC
mmetsp:Transcript_64622/g.171074  ORF Transcript_64622/g.171074 Transcript_64622/m.171074 type:complete len:368 (-) Transcript_64622:93-1196(-)